MQIRIVESFILTEDLLLEKDNRTIIKNKIFPIFEMDKELFSWLADAAHELSPKYSIWIVRSFLQDIEKNALYDKAINSYLDVVKERWGHEIRMRTFHSILDWFQGRTATGDNTKINFDALTLSDAERKSIQWHRSLEAEGFIADEKGVKIINYPDGYYWVDLQTDYSPDESKAMGHCGRCSGSTLYSLRKNKKPFVTIALSDTLNGKVLQAKGKQNTKPIPEYHPYIVDFLIKKKISGFASTYRPETDFQIGDLNPQLKEKILKELPKIIHPLIDYIKRYMNDRLTVDTLRRQINKYFADDLETKILSGKRGLQLKIRSRDIDKLFGDSEDADEWSNIGQDPITDFKSLFTWVDDNSPTDESQAKLEIANQLIVDFLKEVLGVEFSIDDINETTLEKLNMYYHDNEFADIVKNKLMEAMIDAADHTEHRMGKSYVASELENYLYERGIRDVYQNPHINLDWDSVEGLLGFSNSDDKGYIDIYSLQSFVTSGEQDGPTSSIARWAWEIAVDSGDIVDYEIGLEKNLKKLLPELMEIKYKDQKELEF